MIYFVSDGKKYTVMGILDEGRALGFNSLLTKGIDVLKRATDLYFTQNEDLIDISVKDSDDVVDVSSLYTAFKQFYKNRELNSIILVEALDTNPKVIQFKKAACNYAMNLKKAFGLELSDFDKMLIERAEFDVRGKAANLINNNVEVLGFDNIFKNTGMQVRNFIESKTAQTQVSYENRKLLSEEQKVFFYATPTSVMPSYDDVRDIDTDSLDKYTLKSVVPKYHKYIGPYVNYHVGAVGSTSGYANGEYIKDGSVAAVLNDMNFKKKLTEFRVNYSRVVIGERKLSITPMYVTGDSEYDGDPIKENERDYYNALCKFVDECLVRDILEVPVIKWIELGLNVRDEKYLPNLKYVQAPFNKIDFETLELTDDDSRVFTLERLAEVGLTVDVFRELGAGSPTSNKWFTYAINVALVANRAYSGLVSVPFGYDSFEFIRNEVVRDSFDEKYRLFRDGYIKTGRGLRSFEDIDSSDSESRAYTVEDYEDPYSEVGMVYWYGIKDGEEYVDDVSVNSGSMVIRDTESTSLGLNMGHDMSADLTAEVVNYCLFSGILYSMPEALIKCLRFGRNKPKCLQLDGLMSRVDLTTAEIITDINYSNPVEFEVGKPHVISKIVTVESLSEDVKTFLQKNCGVRTFHKIIIGVGLLSKYQQDDGSVAKVTEYYDMQTLVNDTELQGKIANLENGRIIESNPATETVASVMDNASRSVVDVCVQPNASICMQVINKYLDELKAGCTAYSAITNMSKAGFNMFTFAQALATMKELLRYVKIIQMDKATERLESMSIISDVKALLNVDLLLKYGGVLKECLTKSAITDKELFAQTFETWNKMTDYAIQTNISHVAEPNTVDVVGNYLALVKSRLPVHKDFKIFGVVDNVNKDKKFFYLLQNQAVNKKFYVVSGIKMTDDAVRGFCTSTSDYKELRIGQVIQLVENNMKKAPRLSVGEIVDLMFEFVDDDTKVSVKNLITNNVRG